MPTKNKQRAVDRLLRRAARAQLDMRRAERLEQSVEVMVRVQEIRVNRANNPLS